jgi:demethylmenaquinone methyltransferase / 2-methoxy-6-polyprenyl-1,4-benzoquinol methylase
MTAAPTSTMTPFPTATPPTPGAPETRAVRSMFDRIAPRYDLLNRVLSAGTDVRWRRAAVDFLGLPGPLRVLDLCTGTADLLIEAVGRHPSSQGIGLDLSRPMLQRGARKLGDRALASRTLLCQGDAEALPFASAWFDAALVAFGIRNVGGKGAALAEVGRVLRPGGRLVVLEFSMPRGPLGVLYRLYFGHVLPRVGAVVSGDPGAYRYLPHSVAVFPPPSEFVALMGSAGFHDVHVRPLTAGIAQLYRGER